MTDWSTPNELGFINSLGLHSAYGRILTTRQLLEGYLAGLTRRRR